MVQLRERLAKFIREKRGDIPQREFARKIGVTQSTVMRIENRDQNVTLKTLETLCRAFHSDIGDLFPRVDDPKLYPPRVRSGLTTPAPRSAAWLHEHAPESSPQGTPVRGQKPSKKKT